MQGLISQNRGKFLRIIAQSGSALKSSFPYTDTNPLEKTERLGKAFVDCKLWPTEALMSCLRNKTNEEIKKAMEANRISATSFQYVIDNDLIHTDPRSLLTHSDTQVSDELEFYRSLGVINGFNSHDGFLLYGTTYPLESDVPYISREEIKTSISFALMFYFDIEVDDSVMEMVMAEYTNWSNMTSMVDKHLQLIKIYTDIAYGTPAIKTSLIHEQAPSSSKLYMYHLAADSSVRPLPMPEWITGANHADDIYFVFGIEAAMIGSDPETTWEIQLSRKMIRYWTNFMTSGSPNYPIEVSPWWPEYDNAHQRYLTLESNTTEQSAGQYLYNKETNFWYNVFPAINEAINSQQPTHCPGPASSASVVPPFLGVLGVVLASILCM